MISGGHGGVNPPLHPFISLLFSDGSLLPGTWHEKIRALPCVVARSADAAGDAAGNFVRELDAW
jgi:hypothetical protein